MQVNLSRSDVTRARLMLSGVRNGFPKAFYRTLNKTAAGTKTDLVNLVRRDYNYKATVLRKRITVYKCPSYKTLKAETRSVGPGIHLTDIAGTRQTTRGITVDVKKSTGRKLIPRAFIAPGRFSRKKIGFIRETEAGRMVPRTPISPLYASHPEVIYNTRENWARIEKQSGKRLDENFSHEVQVILKGIA